MTRRSIAVAWWTSDMLRSRCANSGGALEARSREERLLSEGTR